MKIIRLLIILTAFLLMYRVHYLYLAIPIGHRLYQRRFYGLFNDSRYTVKLQE